MVVPPPSAWSHQHHDLGITTQSPLPHSVYRGLVAVGTFGFLSFLSTTAVFLYMTWMLVRWKRRIAAMRAKRRAAAAATANQNKTLDLSLGLEAKYLGKKGVPGLERTDSAGSESDQANIVATDPDHEPENESLAGNPFLTYLYNLVIADMAQSLGYMLSLVWIAEDGVYVPSNTCWSQGWFTNVGTIGPAVFLIIISVHTYLTVVWAYRPPPNVVHGIVAFAWILTFAIPSIPVGITRNGSEFGGWYVRVHCWCQINLKYSHLRFWFEYFWIILAISVTAILYSLMFVYLWRNKQSSRHLPRAPSSSSAGSLTGSTRSRNVGSGGNGGPGPGQQLSGHHPAFLVYPLVYFFTIAPIFIGRLIEINGGQLQNPYHYTTGCLLAAQGLFNSILWTTTLLFLSRQSIEEVGLMRFVRTPEERRYGNMVWIQGGERRGAGDNSSELHNFDDAGDWRTHPWFAWWPTSIRKPPAVMTKGNGSVPKWRGNPLTKSHHERVGSEETLQCGSGSGKEAGIQMETVTSVVVEKDK